MAATTARCTELAKGRPLPYRRMLRFHIRHSCVSYVLRGLRDILNPVSPLNMEIVLYLLVGPPYLAIRFDLGGLALTPANVIGSCVSDVGGNASPRTSSLMRRQVRGKTSRIDMRTGCRHEIWFRSHSAGQHAVVFRTCKTFES
jgi:hypothetical protein